VKALVHELNPRDQDESMGDVWLFLKFLQETAQFLWCQSIPGSPISLIESFPDRWAQFRCAHQVRANKCPICWRIIGFLLFLKFLYLNMFFSWRQSISHDLISLVKLFPATFCITTRKVTSLRELADYICKGYKGCSKFLSCLYPKRQAVHQIAHSISVIRL